MGEALAKLARIRKQQQGGDDKGEDKLSDQEQRAYDKMLKEAKEHGATLANGGKGGLAPSFVLGCLRRDGWRCPVCGGKDNLSLHHKGGIVESRWLSMQGHKTTPANVTTCCEKCHDRLHEKARERGTDSSQVTPEGDRAKA